METFQFIPTLFRSSGNFPVHPDTLHIIWIFCIVSGHFPKYPEILQQIMSLLQKLSGFAKTFRIRKNFPVSIADALTGFFWLCLHVATSSDIDLAHHQCWLRKPSRVGGLTESCLTWPSHLFILLWTPSSACSLPVMWDLFFSFQFFHAFQNS